MKEILNSTYLYAILIFLGFYNLFCFYDYFGINITSYLTTGELLLSFLQLTTAIIIVLICSLIVIFGAGILNASISTNKGRAENYDDDILSLFLFCSTYKGLIKRNKENNFFSKEKIFRNLCDIISLLFGGLIILFFVAFIFGFIGWLTGKCDVSPGLALIPSVFWLLIFDNTVKKLYNKGFKNYIRFIIILLFLVALINISNVFKAKQIVKEKRGAESIVFEYNDTIVKSDTNIVLIGRTENYIFLRDINKEMNIVYPKDKIGKIIIRNGK